MYEIVLLLHKPKATGNIIAHTSQGDLFQVACTPSDKPAEKELLGRS